jgi:hypothetical protein
LITTTGISKLIGFGLVRLLEGSHLLPPQAPGVPAEVDVRALQQMIGWLCETLGQPIPAPLDEMRQPGSVSSAARVANALNSFLKAE